MQDRERSHKWMSLSRFLLRANTQRTVDPPGHAAEASQGGCRKDHSWRGLRGWTIIWPLWCLLAAFAWHPIVTTIHLALTKEEYTYVLLIPCVSAAAIFSESRSIIKISQFGPVAGLIIFVFPALLLTTLYARFDALSSDSRLVIQMSALVLSWMGGFALCLGLRAFRSALFPLLLMFGIVPIPRAALDFIVNQLQQGSASIATALFWVAGVPVVHEGAVMTIPGLTILVAPECSSIRSTSLLFITALTLAQFLLSSRWHRALVVCVAVSLSVGKNGLRIFTIAMLGTRVDPKFLTGSLHHQGGLAFFTIALVPILLLLFALRRREQNHLRFDMRQS